MGDDPQANRIWGYLKENLLAEGGRELQGVAAQGHLSEVLSNALAKVEGREPRVRGGRDE